MLALYVKSINWASLFGFGTMYNYVVIGVTKTGLHVNKNCKLMKTKD